MYSPVPINTVQLGWPGLTSSEELERSEQMLGDSTSKSFGDLPGNGPKFNAFDNIRLGTVPQSRRSPFYFLNLFSKLIRV